MTLVVLAAEQRLLLLFDDNVFFSTPKCAFESLNFGKIREITVNQNTWHRNSHFLLWDSCMIFSVVTREKCYPGAEPKQGDCERTVLKRELCGSGGPHHPCGRFEMEEPEQEESRETKPYDIGRTQTLYQLMVHVRLSVLLFFAFRKLQWV